MTTDLVETSRATTVGKRAIVIGIAGGLAFLFLLAPSNFAVATPQGSVGPAGLFAMAHYGGPLFAALQMIGGIGLMRSRRWGHQFVESGSFGVIVCCAIMLLGMFVCANLLNDWYPADQFGLTYWLFTAWRVQAVVIVTGIASAVALRFWLPRLGQAAQAHSDICT